MSLSREYCRRWSLSYLGESRTTVRLAAAAQLPEEERLRLRSYFGKEVHYEWVSEEALLLAEAATLSGEQGARRLSGAEIRERERPGAPAVIVCRALLVEATRQGASDLHLRLTEEALTSYLRIHGELREHLSFSSALGEAVIRRLLALAALDPFSLATSQEGRLTLPVASGSYDLRLSLLRRRRAELSLALRIFPPPDRRLELDRIVPDQATRLQLRRLASLEGGLLLLCGPTGCGKSTTLHAMLRGEARSGRRVVTLEDPVEQEESLFLQLDLRELSQARGVLEASLRQDPDILVLGEIRNGETLAWAVEAALTGHLVLSTLHVSSLSGAVDRLLELGGEEAALREVLRGVMTQRLVRATSPHAPAGRVALLSLANLAEEPLDVPRLTGDWWRRYLGRNNHLDEASYRSRLEKAGYRFCVDL